MSQYGDQEAGERADVRAQLPASLVEVIRHTHYSDLDLDGAMLARLHLGTMAVDQGFIHPDGTMTPNGEETLRSLSAIAAWNRVNRAEAFASAVVGNLAERVEVWSEFHDSWEPCHVVRTGERGREARSERYGWTVTLAARPDDDEGGTRARWRPLPNEAVR